MADRIGTPTMILGGLAGVATGLLAFSVMPTTWGIAGYIGATALMTAGYALFQTANNAAVMADVAQNQRGVVSGLLALSRNLGLVTGASVMGAVFARASGMTDLVMVSSEPSPRACGSPSWSRRCW